jgi:uncharacterized membrane protein YphA (DoxX/SURF4 family)
MPNIIEWLIPAAQAHEKWIVDASKPIYPVPNLFVTFNPVTIAAIVSILILTVALYLLDRRFERSTWYAVLEAKVHPLRDYAAGVLALCTSVTLFWMSFHGVLLADNLPVPPGAFGSSLMGLQVVIAVLLLIGLYTAGAAIGLLLLYGALFFIFPMADVMDYLHYAGIGVFLLAFARGRFSLDWLLGKGMLTDAETRKRAYLALRVLTGVTMLILALGKWLHPDLLLRLMDAYPDFNPYTILRSIGFTGLSREVFVFCIFCVEFFVGLTVLLGSFTRILGALLVPVFTGSIIFLGVPEVFGHLPILGILFVFFIFGDTYHKSQPLARSVPAKPVTPPVPGPKAA